MSKTCARCEKTVYPTEELKCLDKTWHKGCFKCQVCGMTLNMRTYKGFNKQPYCEAHIPKAKATTMAETPELKRIAENTKIQSNVKYHEDFEKSKGKFTQVADDPETLRIKQNSKIISNVAYHGELEKKAAMEQKRTLNENGEYVDVPANDDHAPNRPPSVNNTQSHAPPPIHHITSSSSSSSSQSHNSQPPQHSHHHHHQAHQSHNASNAHVANNPSAMFVQQEQAAMAHQVAYASAPSGYHANYGPQTPQQHPQVGKISDYDPMTEQQPYSPYSARQSSTLIYTSNQGPVSNLPQRKIGSVSDLDPVNDVYGSLSNDYRGGNANHHQQSSQQHNAASYANHNMPHHQHQQQQIQMQQQQQQIQHQQQQQQPPMTSSNMSNLAGRVYKALYDYEAQDADEVSFSDGDLIIQTAQVDEGWMTGTVQRTGRTGMLPANYVQRVQI